MSLVDDDEAQASRPLSGPVRYLSRSVLLPTDIVGAHEPRPAQPRSSRQFPPSSGSQDRTTHLPEGGRNTARTPNLLLFPQAYSLRKAYYTARNEAEMAIGLYAVSSHAFRYNSMMGVKPRKSDRGVPDDSENGCWLFLMGFYGLLCFFVRDWDGWHLLATDRNGHDSEHVRGNVRGISYEPNRSLIRLSYTQESTVSGVTTFGRPMPCEMQQRRDGVLPSFCESKLAVLQ
ncbi:uncharacterized protein RSE6_02510 [Rhynchosporium secalis]|uniref:Uncharacterized protein n=1 Tax=Rhynchosporium secalis TaxID=38038 RepID=A0A1E1M210_RHYSE|nr:uncharacterized protein RSE6_02510 [Rhynchosporium secalis]